MSGLAVPGELSLDCASLLEPLACLAELKALGDHNEGSPQPSTKKHSERTAA
jgi:hypothetical protein